MVEGVKDIRVVTVHAFDINVSAVGCLGVNVRAINPLNINIKVGALEDVDREYLITYFKKLFKTNNGMFVKMKS